MSYVEDLIASYGRQVSLPWANHVAPPQRIWMAVYPPEYERKVRLHVPEFETTTLRENRSWALVDITNAFESWMAHHEYAQTYFEEPELLETAMPSFFDHLVRVVRTELEAHQDANGVIALLGAGTLFGLGDTVKVSALVSAVSSSVNGRLLVFFPGNHEHNSYRLLDARDGWDYLATPITAEGAKR